MVSAEYLAGFVDGEGSLSLSRIPRGQSHEYCLRVSIANTDTSILQAIHKDWGGTIHSMGRPRRPKWKPGFGLIWTNAAAAHLLGRIEPHLRTKSHRARVLLEFAAHVRECKRRRDDLGRLLPHSKEEMKFREAFFSRLKRLNRKGVAGLAKQLPEEAKFHRRQVMRGKISKRYLAGFIDGEGSVMITRSRSAKTGYVQYRARVAVGNTDREVLEQIRGEYGGTLHPSTKGNPRWKPGYQLVWTDGVIADLLALVGPHLRLKEKQAALELEFIHHKTNTPRKSYGRGRGFAPHSEEVVQFRETMYRRMKGLNARGVAPPS
jgi:hypothetical protein